MSSDPRAQGEKGALPNRVNRKTSVFEGGNMSGGLMPQERTGKPAEGDAACGKGGYKTPLKIDIPKDNQPVNPKYSSETPIVLNKLPIFEENETNHS